MLLNEIRTAWNRGSNEQGTALIPLVQLKQRQHERGLWVQNWGICIGTKANEVTAVYCRHFYFLVSALGGGGGSADRVISWPQWIIAYRMFPMTRKEFARASESAHAPAECGWELAEFWWDLAECGQELAECGWDLAECGWELTAFGWDLAEVAWELAECGWDLGDCGWDLGDSGYDLAESGWDLAESGWDLDESG